MRSIGESKPNNPPIITDEYTRLYHKAWIKSYDWLQGDPMVFNPSGPSNHFVERGSSVHTFSLHALWPNWYLWPYHGPERMDSRHLRPATTITKRLRNTEGCGGRGKSEKKSKNNHNANMSPNAWSLGFTYHFSNTVILAN